MSKFNDRKYSVVLALRSGKTASISGERAWCQQFLHSIIKARNNGTQHVIVCRVDQETAVVTEVGVSLREDILFFVEPAFVVTGAVMRVRLPHETDEDDDPADYKFINETPA